ncbi:uncharacterized protein N7515_001255, partial [Penicillium bovifimosum]
PSLIPRLFLTPPAKLALEQPVYSRIDSPYFWAWHPPEDLTEDARFLLDKCKALTYEVLAHWSYDTVFKLALTTWHFDHWDIEKPPSSASKDLISFLSRPNNDIIEILQDRYRSMMGQGAALSDSFDFLLVLN